MTNYRIDDSCIQDSDKLSEIHTKNNESFLSKTKNFLQKTQHKWKPWIGLTQRTVQLGSSMREKTNFLDWTNLAWSTFSDYKSNIASDSSFYKNYENLYYPIFMRVFINILKTKYSKFISLKEKNGNDSYYIFNMDDLLFEWSENSDVYSTIYYKNISKEKIISFLHQIFWESFPSKRVIISPNKELSDLEITEDFSNEGFVASEKISLEANEIKKFHQNGYGRSILFYGPPGSGKTNLIKGICNNLQFSTLKFENLPRLNANLFLYMVSILNSDCIILEDLDSMESYDIKSFLSKLEELNKKSLIILATCNQLHVLNNASIRPERFDKLVQVSSLEENVVLVLIENDLEIFELVKNWPAVFIKELMLRVKILGKEEALASRKDLEDRIVALGREIYNLNSEPKLNKLSKVLNSEPEALASFKDKFTPDIELT